MPAIKAWKKRMLTITGAEDHHQVMRGVQGTHELSRDASRRRQGNEVQKAIQAENKEDHARQISGDWEAVFITSIDAREKMGIYLIALVITAQQKQ